MKGVELVVKPGNVVSGFQGRGGGRDRIQVLSVGELGAFGCVWIFLFGERLSPTTSFFAIYSVMVLFGSNEHTNPASFPVAFT